MVRNLEVNTSIEHQRQQQNHHTQPQLTSQNTSSMSSQLSAHLHRTPTTLSTTLQPMTGGSGIVPHSLHQLSPQLGGHLVQNMTAMAAAATAAAVAAANASQHHAHLSSQDSQQAAAVAAASFGSFNSLNSINSSVSSLMSADHLSNGDNIAIGLNSQEATLLNFLRTDAADRQRDKR